VIARAHTSRRQSSFIRLRARVHADADAAPILILRPARVRRPAPNPILSRGGSRYRRPRVARPRVARRSDPPPARPRDASRVHAPPARARARRARSRASRARLHRVPIASRSRLASRQSFATHRNGSNPLTAPNCARAAVDFCARAARACTRGRATLESVCAIIIPSSRCGVDAARASRAVAIFRAARFAAPRLVLDDRRTPSRRRGAASRHRSVRHLRRNFVIIGFIVCGIFAFRDAWFVVDASRAV